MISSQFFKNDTKYDNYSLQSYELPMFKEPSCVAFTIYRTIYIASHYAKTHIP